MPEQFLYPLRKSYRAVIKIDTTKIQKNDRSLARRSTYTSIKNGRG